MRLPEVNPAIQEYLQNAFIKSQQWRLPNGESAENSSAIAVAKVAVIGGGTMGRGIAIAAVRAGFGVTLVENDPKSLQFCCNELEVTYQREVKLGRLPEKDLQVLRSDKFKKTTKLTDLHDVDLVIEAVFEEMQLKKDLFSKLDKICKKSAIFGTNTSSLDIDEMSSVLEDPSRLVGIHFFNPAHVLLVVEIVHGKHTSSTAVATAFSAVGQMKKIPILVGNCPNFMFNRLLAVYLNQAHKLMYVYGLYPTDIDKTVTQYGLLMGPITMHDMNGIDVSAKIKKAYDIPLNPIESELLRRERFGRKNDTKKLAKGFYKYDEKRVKSSDPEIECLIDKMAKDKNRIQQIRTASDIIEFLLYPMVNEGFLCLEEGIIADQSLIDLMFIFGFGFPTRLGGPMRWATQCEGLTKIGERMRNWHAAEPNDRTFKLCKQFEGPCGTLGCKL